MTSSERNAEARAHGHPRDAQLPALTTYRITKIITDAVSSVARLHQAHAITASANVQNGSVAINLDYDGRDDPEDRNGNGVDEGDTDLRSQIESFGGTFSVEKSLVGTQLKISLPVLSDPL